MVRTTLALLALALVPATASAQRDTTRRGDTTRTAQQQDSARRVQEARGQVDVTSLGARFRAELPNHGLTVEQAMELQQALSRAGCDVGTTDGIVGQRTLQGIECFRTGRNLGVADLESVLTALEVSFARPAAPAPAPPRRDTTVLPPVIRPDTNYRADVRARRDSARRDSVRRDSLRRDSTLRRDTTARRDTTGRGENKE